MMTAQRLAYFFDGDGSAGAYSVDYDQSAVLSFSIASNSMQARGRNGLCAFMNRNAYGWRFVCYDQEPKGDNPLIFGVSIVPIGGNAAIIKIVHAIRPHTARRRGVLAFLCSGAAASQWHINQRTVAGGMTDATRGARQDAAAGTPYYNARYYQLTRQRLRVSSAFPPGAEGDDNVVTAVSDLICSDGLIDQPSAASSAMIASISQADKSGGSNALIALHERLMDAVRASVGAEEASAIAASIDISPYAHRIDSGPGGVVYPPPNVHTGLTLTFRGPSFVWAHRHMCDRSMLKRDQWAIHQSVDRGEYDSTALSFAAIKAMHLS
jgi:hypothetical protein